MAYLESIRREGCAELVQRGERAGEGRAVRTWWGVVRSLAGL